jgi:sulfonate transport system substrate-binding protein
VILQTEFKDPPTADALSPQLDADFLGKLDASILAAKQFGLIRRVQGRRLGQTGYLAAAAKQAAVQPVAQAQ